jgi:lipopolysaccharide biosynthesis glycosyltransferase
MNEQHVAFCCSGDKGAKHLAVALLSLFETHDSPDKLRVHLVWESLSETALDALNESWQCYSTQISYYRASGWLGERALGPKSGYWFRTWLADILPEDIPFVLYLDYDVLVMRDVSPLWNLDMDNYGVAAVAEPANPRWGYAERLSFMARTMGAEFEKDDPYFNSGVLFINLKRWREMDVGHTLTERFGHYRPTYPEFHDQDELNILFRDELLLLPPCWNLIEEVWLYSLWPFHLYREFSPTSEHFKPYVRHFSGKEKVEGRWRRASYKEIYYGFLDRTAWTGWRSENDRTWVGRQLAQLLDLHYFVIRGVLQKTLPGHASRIGHLVLSNPLLPFFYLAVPLNRLWCRLRYGKQQGSSAP